MSKFLIDMFREKLGKINKEQLETVKEINKQIIGLDAILKNGKYKGRKVQIQRYYFDSGDERLHVLIYRLNDKVGFKGREQFIDDHYHEYIRLIDCEIL
jgi:phospholipase C